jgi:hypothetical protein
MPHCRSLACLAAVVLVLSACATAPAPPPVQAASSAPRKVTLLCGATARAAVFDQIGVPAGERPLDVAVTDKYIWVLFEPSRLLRIVRKGEKVDVEMIVGQGDERWSALAVDPADDSIWVTSPQKLAFLHVSPTWQRKVIPLQKVVGDGGFGELTVAADGLYARPTVAEKLIWRIDRTGKVLDTAFVSKAPPAAGAGPAEIRAFEYQGVRLLRDGEGHVLVWDGSAGKLFQADGKGGWTERADIHWFDHSPDGPTVKGIDVGGKEERWFRGGGLGELFYWKGRPVFLGPYAWAERSTAQGAQVFYVPGDGVGKPTGDIAEYLEVCQGRFLSKVAANATSYAAITDKAVLFGDLASAPDLP